MRHGDGDAALPAAATPASIEGDRQKGMELAIAARERGEARQALRARFGGGGIVAEYSRDGCRPVPPGGVCRPVFLDGHKREYYFDEKDSCVERRWPSSLRGLSTASA
jgi:hypothetical protein